ncbi:MAG: hypothetical protein R6V50_03510 [Thermoplasmatota archaeon]
MMKKKFFATQIICLLLISGTLGGMIAFTPVYAEVRDGIVRVLCLSCLKLEPKTVSEFTFETVENIAHPKFILENLSKGGPVFIFYSGDACSGCDIMYPVIKELLSVEFDKQEMFDETISYEGANVSYIYINIHHTTDELKESQYIYDKDFIAGIPMFTIITLGYDKGVVRPKYTTIYGTLASFDHTTDEGRLLFLQNLLQESIYMYQDNIAGYNHH